MRILTVEDDELLAQTIANILSQHHYAVDIASDGEMGWQFATTTAYDLILLDVMLPKLDGVNLCRQFRQAGYQTPILLLTAKDGGSDKVIGLDAGADDYMVKPVNFDELTARIRATLRRGHPDPSPLLRWAALTLDPGSLEVTYEGQPVHLTSTEYRLLELLLRNPQRVFSRSAIVEHLWTFDEQPETATVKTYIKNLRQKLKIINESADLIETVYGLGYRLKPQPQIPKTIAPSSSMDQNSKEQQVFMAVTRARDSFNAQIRDRLTVLQQLIETITAGSLNIELCQQAISEAHRFAGALGTFGFETASQLAEAIEDLLRVSSFKPEQARQLQQLVHQLGQELGQPSIQPAIDPMNGQHHWLIISQDTQWSQAFIEVAEHRKIQTKIISHSLNNHEFVEEIINISTQQNLETILLDLSISSNQENSFTLLNQLSKQLPFIPVLGLAEKDEFCDRIAVVRRGGKGFLLKTASTVQILNYIQQIAQQPQLNEARVLAIDNDLYTLNAIRDFLESYKLQFKLLDNSQQFWQVLIDFSPNLLIISTEMPGISGFELGQMIRQDIDWNKLPILFLVDRTDADTLHQLFAVTADDYIEKPITQAKLMARILNRFK